MERQSARLPLFARIAITLALLGAGAVQAQSPPMLTQEQLEGDPAAVASWLQENGSKADRKTAASFAKMAARYKARRDWSGAAKGYGESAVHYPDPVVILEYAHARALHLATVRAHARRPDLAASDAASSQRLYQVVQAAQSVAGTLNKAQVTAVEQAIQCLSAPNAASEVATDCAPMKAYRAEYERVSQRR